MIMNCTTKTIYQSMEACPGQKVLPGIRRRLYFASKSDIATFPKLPKATDEGVTDMAALAQLTGSFAMRENKYFNFIDLKDEASNVTFETVDESKLFNNQVNAVVRGIKDEVKGFARQAVDDDLVFVYQNRDGSFAVIGNEMFETHTVPSGDTAAEASGAKTATFAINCYDECPVPTYTGKLPISATQQLNCETGLIEAVTPQT